MRLFLLLSLLVALLICVACTNKDDPIPDHAAKHLALSEFMSFCKNFNLDPANFEGPADTTVGNAEHAFHWMHRSKSIGILVAVDQRFLVHLSLDGENDAWEEVLEAARSSKSIDNR